jgi:hypothetical protein
MQVRGRSGVEELALASLYHGRRSNKAIGVRLEPNMSNFECITSVKRNIRTVPLQLYTCSNNSCYISLSSGMCMYRFASKRGSLHLFSRCLSNAINPCHRAGVISRCVPCMVYPLSVLSCK